MDVGGPDEKSQNIQSWVYYGRGHMGKDCPTKCKSKGKGNNKCGKNKYNGYKDRQGRLQGQEHNDNGFSGCFNCGGPHYAA
eukprot:16438472-Heterocapsa_arctica.AAC.1